MSAEHHPFDQVADHYDQIFSQTPIGQLMREQVYFFLQPLLTKSPQHILELNAGTGLDAVWLAKRGHRVHATDIASQMVAKTDQLISAHHQSDRITTQVLSINDLPQLPHDHQYDLVFSNFGGLNCLSPEELTNSATHIRRLLKPGGQFVAVVMNDFCVWEILFFIFKLRFSKAFRRKRSQGKPVRLNTDTSIATWYYNYGNFKSVYEEYFETIRVAPVGLFLPPPFLFNKKKWTNYLVRLSNLDKRFQSVSFLSRFSDHFIIQCQAK